ncbi:hypothetical protein OROHE_002019 [Orobanche hederae]
MVKGFNQDRQLGTDFQKTCEVTNKLPSVMILSKSIDLELEVQEDDDSDISNQVDSNLSIQNTFPSSLNDSLNL